MKRWDGIWKIISPHIKRLGPDGNIHEGWCAIFERDCCSCKRPGRRKNRKIGRDGGGSKLKVPPKLEDA